MKLRQKLRKNLLAAGTLGGLLLACSQDIIDPNQEAQQENKQNSAPVITSNPPRIVNENSFYEHSIVASDRDENPISYSLSEGPGWLSVSHNVVYGMAPEVARNTVFPVTIKASDGTDYDTKSFNLTVKNLSNTRLLSETELEKITSVDEDRIVFSSPVDFSVGDIIVSGINEKTPSGILREIDFVSSDRRRITTQTATFGQVMPQGNFSYSGSLNSSQIQSINCLEGVLISQSPSIGNASQTLDFNLSINDVVLYDEDGNPATTGDQLKANGNISFNTDFDFNMNIENSELQNFVFVNRTSISSDVTLGSNIFGIAGPNQKKIAEYKFQPILMGYLPTPIPIPVISVPILSVYVGINAANVNPLSVRVAQESNLEAGIKYSNGNWNPIANFSNSFDFTNPFVDGTSFDLRAHVGPGLEVLIYGFSGPFVSASGRLRLEATNQEDWRLYGGLGASAGVKMEVLKRGVSAQLLEVINYEQLLAEGNTGAEPQGKIAFVRRIGGNIDVHVMNADGSGQVNVTNSPSLWDTYPSWSPNGTQIIHSSKTPFTNDYDNLFSINPDGSNRSQLTNNGLNNNYAVFSPDASQIAFSASPSTTTSFHQVYVMNADGSNSVKVTNNNNFYYWDLSWAPCQRIAFVSNMDGNSEIYTMQPDGSDVRRLTNNTNTDYYPAWSPDCTKIAYASLRNGSFDIYVMNADGSSQENLSNTPDADLYIPSWSPDGSRLAYVKGSDDAAEIWTMKADGSGKQRLTNNQFLDSFPKWSHQ